MSARLPFLSSRDSVRLQVTNVLLKDIQHPEPRLCNVCHCPCHVLLAAHAQVQRYYAPGLQSFACLAKDMLVYRKGAFLALIDERPGLG